MESRILTETLAISGSMALLSAVPLYSRRARGRSKLLFLLGTGALTGLLAFDLLPDLLQMAGPASLWGVALVWALYTAAHLLHVRSHHAEDHHHSHEWSLAFLASMVAHCLTSGMLLVLSDGVSAGAHRTVFFALLAHKTYEALTVSSILSERQRSKAATLGSLAVYCGALPAGVLLTLGFRAAFTQSLALAVTSLAVGTLLGCLSFDFLLPSLAHVRSRRGDWGWIFLGLGFTQLLMRAL